MAHHIAYRVESSRVELSRVAYSVLYSAHMYNVYWECIKYTFVYNLFVVGAAFSTSVIFFLPCRVAFQRCVHVHCQYAEYKKEIFASSNLATFFVYFQFCHRFVCCSYYSLLTGTHFQMKVYSIKQEHTRTHSHTRCYYSFMDQSLFSVRLFVISRSVLLSVKSVAGFASAFLHLSVKTELSCYNFYHHPIYFAPFNHNRIHSIWNGAVSHSSTHFNSLEAIYLYWKKTFQLTAIDECKHIIYIFVYIRTHCAMRNPTQYSSRYVSIVS